MKFNAVAKYAEGKDIMTRASCFDTVGVAGSIPVEPTIKTTEGPHFANLRDGAFPFSSRLSPVEHVEYRNKV